MTKKWANMSLKKYQRLLNQMDELTHIGKADFVEHDFTEKDLKNFYN